MTKPKGWKRVARPKRKGSKRVARLKGLDKEIRQDLKYFSSGGWVTAITDLQYQLRFLRGPWLVFADQLEPLLSGIPHLSRNDEAQRLDSILTELAVIYNHEKADMSEQQRRTLDRLLDNAIQRVKEKQWAIAQDVATDEVARPNLARKLGEIEAKRQAPENSRDKFIYESRIKGKSLKEIMAKVNKRKTWEPLETVQGVSNAASRYAKSQGLAWPI